MEMKTKKWNIFLNLRPQKYVNESYLLAYDFEY